MAISNAASGTINLTPQQFVAQINSAPHNFQVELHNFEVKIGRAAVKVFKGSFDKKRMNTQGSKPWPHWQGKYSGKELLYEHGTLKNSIKVKSRRAHKIIIHTDPAAFNNSPRHRGFCYAAVHNNFSSLANKPLRGPIAERQFIGHSTELEEKMKEYSLIMLAGIIK